MSNGVLVRGVYPWFGAASSDQQLSSGSLIPMMLYEVKQGKITRRLLNGVVQFNTTALWKAIAAVGDASTVDHWIHEDWRGTYTTIPISAPAMHVTRLDVRQL